jgi:hypothetical protein
MNFRDFEMRIDRGLHRDDVVIAAEAVDERAEIWK